MAEVDQARVRGDPLPKLLDDLCGGSDRQRDRALDILRTRFLAGICPGMVASPILVVAGQDFIAGFQGRARMMAQAVGDHIHAISGIGDVGDMVWLDVERVAQDLARLTIVFGKISAEELHRLVLQLTLPGLVGLEDRPGTGPIGPVVEKDDLGIEEEEGF